MLWSCQLSGPVSHGKCAWSCNLASDLELRASGDWQRMTMGCMKYSRRRNSMPYTLVSSKEISASRRARSPGSTFPPPIDPPAQLLARSSPIPLIDAPSQRRCLQPPSAKVEREIHDGSEPAFWLRGQHRAVAQRRGECRLQVARQIDLSFCLRDRRMLGIAEMTVPNRPEPCWADIGNGSDLDSALHLTLESLEALGQGDGCLGNLAHGLTRSNTRPMNQKFSTPAHRAWSASVQAACTAGIQSTPASTAPTKAAVLAAQ
jgi:hypothetical protein